MEKQHVLRNARNYVKGQLKHDASGHDWWHIHRVTSLAIELGKKESADLFIVELAALLHDIADEKLNDSEEEGLVKVENWLIDQHVEEELRQYILTIITNMSFKGGNRPPMATLEGQVVQDADRLDAIGAVGIARTFAYAGNKGDLMYDPNIEPREKMSQKEYRTGQSTAINHFYEKLLKLKERMNTNAAKEIAEERHRYMEEFLEQFYSEWNGKR